MKRPDYSPLQAKPNPKAAEFIKAWNEYYNGATAEEATETTTPPRPPLTVPPDDVIPCDIDIAPDGTLTARNAQRVTWVYRCAGWTPKAGAGA